MAIKNEIIDELLKDKDPKTIFTSCAFRAMTDSVPDRWRTVFRRDDGHGSVVMADDFGVQAERCPASRNAVRHVGSRPGRDEST